MCQPAIRRHRPDVTRLLARHRPGRHGHRLYTSKVELGTGIDHRAGADRRRRTRRPVGNSIKMDSARHSRKPSTRASTAGSRNYRTSAARRLRQAAAAARQELLKLAAAQLKCPCRQDLPSKDGVVSVAGDAAKKITYGQLIGGKQFNVRITATGTGWDMKVAPEVKAKDPKDYKIVGTSADSRSSCRQSSPVSSSMPMTCASPECCMAASFARRRSTSKPASIDESSVKNIPGVVKVVQEGSFVGVVATDGMGGNQSGQGAQSDLVGAGDAKCPRTPEEVFAYLKNTKSLRDQVSQLTKAIRTRRSPKASKTYRSNLSLAVSIARDARVLRAPSPMSTRIGSRSFTLI